jgi:hypothetical protein
VGMVCVVERRRRGSGKLESSCFYSRKRGWRASTTTLAVIQVMAAFGMFTSRYHRVHFQKKSIASLHLMNLIIWSRDTAPLSSASSTLDKMA